MNAGLPGPPLRALGRRRPSDRDGTNLVQRLPQSLVSPFPLHQVFGPFPRSAASNLVQRLPQSLVSPFPLHQVFGPFPRSAASDLVQGLPQSLITPFPLHQVFGPFPRSAASDLVQGLPQSLISPFLLHQVFGPFPTAPSPLGAAPIGKHFRGTSLPFPQKQKEAAPAAPLPTSSPIRRKSPAGDFRLLFSTENP